MIGRMDSTRYRRSVRFVAGATGGGFPESLDYASATAGLVTGIGS